MLIGSCLLSVVFLLSWSWVCNQQSECWTSLIQSNVRQIWRTSNGCVDNKSAAIEQVRCDERMKVTFFGEKTPTRLLSSLTATPISANTASLHVSTHSHHDRVFKAVFTPRQTTKAGEAHMQSQAKCVLDSTLALTTEQFAHRRPAVWASYVHVALNRRSLLFFDNYMKSIPHVINCTADAIYYHTAVWLALTTSSGCMTGR